MMAARGTEATAPWSLRRRLLAAIVAVLLNLFFNGLASSEKARQQARENSHGSD